MWTPYIVHVFNKPRPTRDDIERRMEDLNDLRNRVAHHEHLLKTDIAAIHSTLLELAGWISPNVASHIAANSNVLDILAARLVP